MKFYISFYYSCTYVCLPSEQFATPHALVKMEGLKQFITPSRFSLFGYIVAVLYLLTGAVFVGITSKLRLNEHRTFLCDFQATIPDKNFHQAQCFEKYEEQYNSPLPWYLFVLLTFAAVIVLCIAYSWCCVKSRVDRLQAAMVLDAENPRPRPRIRTRRVFAIYFIHLATRLVLGIAFTLMQNFVLYPGGFPAGYACVLSTASSFNTSASSKTVSHTPNCHNSVASEKNSCMKMVLIVNIIFNCLVFGEIIYLLARATHSSKFTFDSEFCSKYFFHESSTQVTPAGFRKSMKKRILQETEFLEPLIHCSAEQEEGNILLDDVFLDVIIYTGRAKDKFLKDCERHQIYDSYLKPESQHGSVAIKTRGELFLSNKDTRNPRKILIVGRPGIGKSLLCQKLLRDWSKGDLFRDKSKNFKYAFLFQFRSFYSETGKISLWQLLTRTAYLASCRDDQLFQELLDHPEETLLVFDGLDEFKDHDGCTTNEAARFGNSPSEEMPLPALYVKLLQGKLLPGATLLTSCRPTVLESVEFHLFDRTVEIMGFTEEKVHKYVNHYSKGDRAIATRIWEHIYSNLNLLSLCYIPVNCRIMCFFLKELIKLCALGSEIVTLPTRLTEVYQGALRLFIFKHHPEFRDKPFRGNEHFSDSVEKTLTDLGLLAWKGIAEGRMIFDSEEVSGMTHCGLLNQLPDSRLSPVEFKQRFCFIHLTLQEFLAAREIAKMDPDDLKEFITSNVEDPKWHLVIQFVAGLLRGRQKDAVTSFVKCLHDSLLSNPQNKKMALLMMKCLYEYNDDVTVKSAASQLQQKGCFRNSFELWNCQITPVDCTAIVYFFRNIKQVNYSLYLGANSLGEGGCRELAKLLIEGGPVKLHLRKNNITDQGLMSVIKAISVDKCKLQKLSLGLNDLISPDALVVLCGSLKTKSCKLTRLQLGGLQITEHVLSHLCESLEHANCKITSLRFNDEELWTDAVLLKFCQTLKHQNCQVSSLRIECQKITNQGVQHFCETLESEHCKLKKLELISNRMTAVVVPFIRRSLSHPNCKLCKLNIVSWNMNQQVKRDLDEALQAACHQRNSHSTI